MMLRLTLALGAISIATAVPAAAQFTTVVAPPPKVVEARAQAVAQAQASAAARDTGRRATLKEMSAWVDSVAGAPAPSTMAVDSANGSVATDSATTATSTSSRGERAGTTRFQDGARAPNTASPLPLLLVAGLGTTLLGLGVLFTSRRAAPVDVRRRRAQ